MRQLESTSSVRQIYPAQFVSKSERRHWGLPRLVPANGNWVSVDFGLFSLASNPDKLGRPSPLLGRRLPAIPTRRDCTPRISSNCWEMCGALRLRSGKKLKWLVQLAGTRRGRIGHRQLATMAARLPPLDKSYRVLYGTSVREFWNRSNLLQFSQAGEFWPLT